MVDDLETVKTRIQGKKRITTTTPLYFGGVRPGFNLIDENVGTKVQYTGCIGDVTVNNKYVSLHMSHVGNVVCFEGYFSA